MALHRSDVIHFYGIASRSDQDIDDWSPTREEAEAALAEVVSADPAFEEDLYVEVVEFMLCLN